MCRTISEAQALDRTRIRCDLPGCPGYRQKADLAAHNRRVARERRRNVAVYLRDLDGGNQQLKRAVMQARPRELALLVSRMREINPGVAEGMLAAAGGELPGLHNMTMQESRRETVSIDYDEAKQLKDDPGMVSMAALSIAGMESAYLDTQHARATMSPGRIAELQRSAAVRSEMASLGLLGEVGPNGRWTPPPPVEQMNASQLAFYAHSTPESVARVGDVENTVEKQFLDYAMTNVAFQPNRRGRLCSEEQSVKSAAQLAQAGDLGPEGRLAIREGVDLARNPRFDPADPDSLEPEFLYVVDGDIELPVDPDMPVGAQTNTIVSISRLEKRGDGEAPLNQKSLYDRMLDSSTPTGQRVHSRLNEDIIRATFTSGKIPGIDTSIDVTAEEVAHRSGRRPGLHTLSEVFGSKSPLSGRTRDEVGRALAATMQSMNPEMAKSGDYSEMSFEHLNNLRKADAKRFARARRKSRAWENRSYETGKKAPRIAKRGSHRLGDVTTSRGTREHEHRTQIVPGVNALRETYKRIPTLPQDPAKAPKIRATTAERNRLAGPNQTLTGPDVEVLVAQANSAMGATSPESVPTPALAALARVERADQAKRYNRDRHAQEYRKIPEGERPERQEPTVLEQYVVVPASTHGHNSFREGRSFQNTKYAVATSARGEAPQPGPGEKVVRVVYSTRQALPATDTHAVVSPNSLFRVLRRSGGGNSGGIETVHVVDQEMVLDAS